MLKSESDEIRYKLAMYFFVLLWRTPVAGIKKLLTKVEDAAIYLGPDECEEVRDALCMALIVLKSREESYYKKCLKLMRRSVVDMVESAANSHSQALLEKLKDVNFDELNHFAIRQEDGRPHGKGADYKIVQLCPMTLRTISSYLDCADFDSGQEELRMSARFVSNYSENQQTEEDSEETPERDDNERGSRINSSYNKATKEKFKRYKSQGKKPPTITEYTEESKDSRRGPGSILVKKSFTSLNRIKTDANSQEEDSKSSPQYITSARNGSKGTQLKPPVIKSATNLRGGTQNPTVPSHIASPHENSNIKIENHQGGKVTRFDVQEESRDEYQVYDYDYNQPDQQREQPNDYLINDELRMILEGNGKKIPTRLTQSNTALYNEGVVKLAEDIILGGEKDDLIKLHAYFSTLFHKEQSRMTILNNLMDACMYYLAFDQGPFRANAKMVVTVVGEYLRGKTGLTRIEPVRNGIALRRRTCAEDC